MSNLYETLGVDRSASQEEIKKAYRKLASQHHPDRGGDTKKFQEIQAAYDTLIDPERRAAYDNPKPQQGSGGFHFNFGGGFPQEFEEIFGSFGDFGSVFTRRTQQRNKHLNLQTAISLEEAFRGKDLIASIKLPSGRDQMLEVKIPPGVQSGNTLRLAGMGDDSYTNLPRGDLHLTISVLPHPRFQRQGDDLIANLNLNCLEAIIGKTITIETIDGKTLEIYIQPGSQHGQLLSINGYGMPNINNPQQRGRLLFNVNITVPTNLSEEQKNQIKKIIENV